MTQLILSRLIQLPVVLVVIFLITFLLAWEMPGSPLEGSDSRQLPPEVLEAMNRAYNLEDRGAFLMKYARGLFLGADNQPPPYFGPSLRQRGRTVNEILAQGMPYSIALGSLAMVFALLIGLGSGLAGAWKPGSALDFGSLSVALVGVSLPSFVVAFLLVTVFALTTGWVPIGGWEWPGWQFWSGEFWTNLPHMLREMLLPALALGLGPAAYISRLTRLGMADVLSSDFIRTARAKGLPERDVFLKHALKVAFLPVLSFLGPAAAATFTGSFVIELVFEIPGIGRQFVNAVLGKDQFLMLGIVLTYSTILIVFNLIVDLAYAWVDPRIEL